jgi:uncharacterized protein YjiS (DUF1127 family)
MSWLAHIARVIFRTWPDRWHLREMDNDQLHDLGISRCDAIQESKRPFWK